MLSYVQIKKASRIFKKLPGASKSFYISTSSLNVISKSKVSKKKLIWDVAGNINMACKYTQRHLWPLPTELNDVPFSKAPMDFIQLF